MGLIVNRYGEIRVRGAILSEEIKLKFLRLLMEDCNEIT